MTSSIWCNNLIAWSLQITVLAAAGALLPRALRLRLAAARLFYFQVLLAACLALPLMQPRRVLLDPSAEVSVRTAVVQAVRPASGGFSIDFSQAVLIALGAGMLLRALWLALGFRRLLRYRRRSSELSPLPPAVRAAQAEMGLRARLCLSEEIAGPVTFGVWRPVILFPQRFLALEPDLQKAITCHELLHVRRRDWAFTFLEECVRVVFWFHPAIWWLLGRIQLAREQSVDGEVVRLTQARERYVEALLAIAGAHALPDLAPAPLFLRKRHLIDRVASILKEVPMSKRRLISVLATCFALLLPAAWLAVGSFPLRATPQEPGITIEQGDSHLLHRAPIEYPREAREKRIEGAVVLEVDINQDGLVSDARVLSGPEELRRAALQSVLAWHYSKDMSLPAQTQVTIQFRLPNSAGSFAGGLRGGESGVLKQIELGAVPQSLRETLMSRLPVHEGDRLTPELMDRVRRVVLDTDEHLSVQYRKIDTESGALRIFLAEPKAATAVSPNRIRVGGNVQQQKLVYQPRPKYPPEAKAARIQGVVQLNAVIGADGRVKNLEVISGEPVLAQAAMESVKDWVYETTLLNGNPIEVVTQIDVNYTLSR